MFLLPLLFGMINFFIIPIVKSFLFSIGNVTTGANGYSIKIQGFKAYYDALFVHTTYRQTVVGAIMDMALSVPLILIFSFIIASILNQKFKGRTFFRVVLFIPVIVAMMISTTNTLEQGMTGFGDYKDSLNGATVALTDQISEFLINSKIPENFVSSIMNTVNKVYNSINLSGIPILILLTGMQSISPSLYEAAKVEGGTSWENFWKITVPMVSPMILTCVVYCITDSFVSSNNGVMALVDKTAFGSRLDFTGAAAMSWIYFAIVAIVLGVAAFCVSRFTFYYDK